MRYIAALAALVATAGALAGCSASTNNSSTSGTDVPLVSNATSTATAAPTITPTTTTKPKQASERRKPPKTAVPKPARPQHACITGGHDNGLYATVSAFRSDHNMAAPSVPVDGDAWYTILSTENGCVTSDSVDEFATPALGASDIMFLTEGIDLPNDNSDVHDGTDCSVFTSATLTKASGFRFAVVTGFAQEGHDAPAHAQISLTNDASCTS